MESAPAAATKPTPVDWFFRVLGFVTLSVIAFATPQFPSLELDASWRMAMGKFFVEGRQFGTEVIFNYGPLGWTMPKTYWGGQWAALVGWYVGQALVMAGLVYWHAYRLNGYRRMFFFLFFFTFGLTYQDAVQQVAMILAGAELIRRSGQAWRWSSLFLVAILVVLAIVKFTNLLLGFFLIALAGGLDLWERRHWLGLRMPALYLGMFLVGWRLCGQHLSNLPAYFKGSWEISQGYQDSMGLSCPPYQLYLGLTVALLMIVFLVLSFFTHPNRIRGLVLMLASAAYLQLNWKHGYIRADGHQIGFYYAVLTVVVAAPLILEDARRWRWVKTGILVAASIVSIVGVEAVLPGLVRGGLGFIQHNVEQNLRFLASPARARALYDGRLENERNAVNLRKVKAEVENATVDVHGFEQAVALYNGLNYQPRPILQSYSVFTPYLSRMNHEHFLSARAPEYVLFKVQAIDSRLPMMDDPEVLRVLVHHYTYLFSEQGFALWKRKAGAYDPAATAPKPVRTVRAKLGEPIDLGDLADQNVWIRVTYDFSLLGKLRTFLFKPPLVNLRVTDDQGVESVHRLPRSIGRIGFMVSPVVGDMLEFMRAHGGVPTRRARSLVLDSSPQDRDCVRDEFAIEIGTLPPSDAGKEYFKDSDKAKFHMFTDTPISYEALNPPNEDAIDKMPVMIFHAPSHLVFQVPAGATTINGWFGFVPGAYSNGGNTNGAEFVISWTEGAGETVLLERFLNPVSQMKDRGLQRFSVRLPKGAGNVYLRINPGPFGEYAFDWTGWSGIEFK